MPAATSKTAKKASAFDAQQLSKQLQQLKTKVEAESASAKAAIDKANIGAGLKSVLSHPFIFGTGIGVGNGFLAAVRGMRFSTRATLVTAAVLTLGEAILAADQTTEQRHGRTPLGFGLVSGVGVLFGLALFTNWQQWSGGDRPILVAELGKKAPAAVSDSSKTAVV
jgi:hypothetical protein